MEFIKTEGTTELLEALSEQLNRALSENKKVLWLVPGGSNIKVVVEVMNKLNATNLGGLTIMLTDERYGPVGHPDSNYYQLMSQGFDHGAATFTNLLIGASLEDTVSSYSGQAKNVFSVADEIIGFFGMGPDSHVAGILPGSPAAVTDAIWASGYEAGQYTRLTLTPHALSHVHSAFVGAFGAEKREALEKLCNLVSTIAEQPARVLCHMPEVKVFNDQIGDKL